EVLNERELSARVEVLLEQYTTIMGIEARAMVDMLRTLVMPAALRSQHELAQTVAATKSAGVECPDTATQLQWLVAATAELNSSIEQLEQVERHSAGDLREEARHVQKQVVPAIERARKASDALEHVVPDDLWPLPRYSEMLFIR
ncbi:MAG: glutamine synthetase type III, partial [Planctomycetota bacterium]